MMRMVLLSGMIFCPGCDQKGTPGEQAAGTAQASPAAARAVAVAWFEAWKAKDLEKLVGYWISAKQAHVRKDVRKDFLERTIIEFTLDEGRREGEEFVFGGKFVEMERRSNDSQRRDEETIKSLRLQLENGAWKIRDFDY